MSETTFEEYKARARRAGERDEDIARTWKLMQDIDRILKDEDVNPFAPPETVLPQKARLARLFIDRYIEATKDGDKAIAAWLRTIADESHHDLAERVEGGEHWKWWYEVGSKIA
jgi:hypothetical protein